MNFVLDGNYQPALTLFWGLLAWLSALGVGLLLLEVLRAGLPTPWRQVVAVLLGFLTLSACIQAVAMAGWASSGVLLALGAFFVLGGMVGLVRHPFQLLPARLGVNSAPVLALLAIIGAALLVNLLVALAPSTKSDEIYYHMLLPQRIVAEGGLSFYRQPWEAAIYPQMLFQMSAVPFYVLGYPDSFNIISWCTGLMLSWWSAYLLLEKAAERQSQGGKIWALSGAAAVVVGMYPVVWYVTAGAHALGDLAGAALIVLIYFRERLVAGWGPRALGLAASVLGVSAAASKVSLLPLVAIGLLILGYTCWKANPDVKPWRWLGWALLPWLLFYLPILIWTYLQSGSPFGPILAGVSGRSIYPVAEIQETLAFAKTENQKPDLETLRNLLANYSPLLWIGLLYGLFSKRIARIDKLILFGLLLFQMLLIAIWLPYDLRFLGGIPYGLGCVAGLAWIEGPKAAAPRAAYFLAPLLLLLPWLALQIYYATPFMQVTLGLTSPATWCEEKIPLCADLKKLDVILAPDAQLLSFFRLASVYTPRPVYYDIHDTRPDRPVYAVFLKYPDWLGPNIGNCTYGPLVYSNPQSRFVIYRNPQQAPLLIKLYIYALNCPPAASP